MPSLIHQTIHHTNTQRLPTLRCVIFTGGNCRFSNPANLGTTKQSLSSAALGAPWPLPFDELPFAFPLAAFAIVEGVVSKTRENVHRGLPRVGNHAVFILVMADYISSAYFSSLVY